MTSTSGSSFENSKTSGSAGVSFLLRMVKFDIDVMTSVYFDPQCESESHGYVAILIKEEPGLDYQQRINEARTTNNITVEAR